MKTKYLVTNVCGHEGGWKVCSISGTALKPLVNVNDGLSFSHYHFFERYKR